MQRRHFLRNTVLGAVGGALLPSAHLFAESSGSIRITTLSKSTPSGRSIAPAKAVKAQRGPTLIKGNTDDLKINLADSGVLNFTARFGNRALFTGGGVAGKSGKASFRSTHVLAMISDLQQFQAAMTAPDAPTGEGMTIGNSICFNYLETTFELEALLPKDFDRRVAGIKNGLRGDGFPMVYAHEALIFDPSNKAITDPFRALSGKTGTLKRLRTPNGYEELADGGLAVSTYRLTPTPKDQSELASMLSRNVTNANDARAITAAFLQDLSLNSQVNTAASIQTLCGTRLIRSATQRTLGCDSQRVAGSFARQRSRFAVDIPDGAIWHALFQVAEASVNGQSTAAALARSGTTRLETFLTMQELAIAGVIKGDSGFKAYA